MTQTATLSKRSQIIWLIRAGIQEKRPARRQYITTLTTGTIKLLCHWLFLAGTPGPFFFFNYYSFVPRMLNIQALFVAGYVQLEGKFCLKTEK